MSRVERELKMKKDIINILKDADFIDGTNLSTNKIQKQDITFWKTILENAKASKNNSYIVYNIQPYSTPIYGDGYGVISRIECIIDLFTINSDESKKTFNLRKKIEQCFDKYPWQIIFNLYEYDTDSKLNHYSYTISNIYGD